MPRDDRIAKLDEPDEGRQTEKPGKPRVPDLAEDEKRGAAGAQQLAVCREHVHGSLAGRGKLWRHRRPGRLLIRDDLEALLAIAQRHGFDGAPAEAARAVP